MPKYRTHSGFHFSPPSWKQVPRLQSNPHSCAQQHNATATEPPCHDRSYGYVATFQRQPYESISAIIRPSGSCKYHHEMCWFPTNLSFLFALHYWLVRASILCNITLFVHALSTNATIAHRNNSNIYIYIYKSKYRSRFFIKKFAEKSPLNLHTDHWHNVVVTWQPGSPSGQSKPRRHHCHRNQSESPPFFLLLLLTVSERVRDFFFLLRIS